MSETGEAWMPHPSFFEGWDSAPTACDLVIFRGRLPRPSMVARTDDPHHPPFSQSTRKGWGPAFSQKLSS